MEDMLMKGMGGLFSWLSFKEEKQREPQGRRSYIDEARDKAQAILEWRLKEENWDLNDEELCALTAYGITISNHESYECKKQYYSLLNKIAKMVPADSSNYNKWNHLLKNFDKSLYEEGMRLSAQQSGEENKITLKK
jgi:hypothetical protein